MDELTGFVVTHSFKPVPAIIMFSVLALFVQIGLQSVARKTEDYWVADRSVSTVQNGMAIGSNWMSAASFMGMAGLVYMQGYFGLGYVIGWTGGYVLLMVFMAAQLRRFGKYTTPDFIGDRFESQPARVMAALVTAIIAFVYCAGQYKGIGMIFAWIFGWDYATSVLIGTMVVLAYVLASGMLGVTKNQVVQYLLLLATFLIPLFFIAQKLGYFYLIPQIGYGEAVYTAMEADPGYAAPWAIKDAYQWMALVFTLMVGTCGLPHVLTRFYVTPDEKSARMSVAWGLFFIGLIYWSSPAYAAFGKILSPAGGQKAADMIIFSASELAGLPGWFIGLLAAGAVSAAFSTTAGLLMSASAAVSHDIYFRTINPEATAQQQLIVARLGTLVLGVLVIIVALKPPALIGQLVAMAFAIAGSTMFPTMLLGIWWGRSNKYGAIAGMAVGLAVSLLALFMGNNPFWSYYIPAVGSALIAAPLNFITNIIVSLITAPPSKEVDRLLLKVHTPASLPLSK